MKDNRYIDECQYVWSRHTAFEALTQPFLGFVLNPKYEKKLIEMNQFSSCVLSQENIDLQEYHVGAKDLVTL